MAHASNADQAEFWNGQPGQNWVRHQVDLDAIHGQVTDRLLRACAPRAGERVLDIGCGAGASSFALAEAVDRSGRVQGVDISAPLVERARERAAERGVENVAFDVADAQDHPFEPGIFDLAASRFGLMFFSDPVAAFRNIGSGLRSGGRIVFAAWAGPEDNPWFAWPHRIAVARLGPVAPTSPEAPGPMAFRDLERVGAILADAGFIRVQGESVEVELHHPDGLDVVPRLSLVGPAARILREKNGTPEDQRVISEGIGAEFARFVTADGIRIPARVNLFRAERP